jgi:hypothetical protein
MRPKAFEVLYDALTVQGGVSQRDPPRAGPVRRGRASSRGTAVSSDAACAACVRLTGVSGVQLTLVNGAEPGESRYSTNEIGGQLEDLRFVLGEGPCQDAIRSGVPVAVPDLDTEENHQRWPLFVLAAGASGESAMLQAERMLHCRQKVLADRVASV